VGQLNGMLENTDFNNTFIAIYSATRWYKTNRWWRSRAVRGFSINICPNLSAHCHIVAWDFKTE